MTELIRQPWPWYVGGIIIGLTVPALLLLGNKHFGISSNLRHICAACLPANIPFFKYEWKKEAWNFFFVGGIMIGALIGTHFLGSTEPIKISPALAQELNGYGINQDEELMPKQLFDTGTLFSLKGLLLFVVGGFLVGFGTRYAGGCTSGHAITGLSNLQLPSLIATISFMAGGFIMANLILPFILKL